MFISHSLTHSLSLSLSCLLSLSLALSLALSLSCPLSPSLPLSPPLPHGSRTLTRVIGLSFTPTPTHTHTHTGTGSVAEHGAETASLYALLSSAAYPLQSGRAPKDRFIVVYLFFIFFIKHNGPRLIFLKSIFFLQQYEHTIHTHRDQQRQAQVDR
jgi:hypothetical protein